MPMDAATGSYARLAQSGSLQAAVGCVKEIWNRPLLLILTLAALLRAASFTGYAGSDDASYAELAHSLAQGSWDPQGYVGPPVFPARVGVFAPVALLFRLFGVHEWTMLLPPVLLSFLSIIVVFQVGRLVAGVRVALIAAFLLSVVPLASRSATLLNADLPAALGGNAAVLCLVLAWRSSLSASRLRWGLGAGLAVGAAWLCKETVVYLLPFLAGYAILGRGWKERSFRVALGLALAFGAVLLLESALYAWRTGDPLYRLHAIHRNYDYNSTWFFAEGSAFGWQHGGYHSAIMERLFRTGPHTLFLSSSFGGVTAAALLVAAGAARARSTPLTLLAPWFGSLVLMFNFASSSLTQYQPLVLFDRYLYPLLAPAVLLVAVGVDRLLTSPPIATRRVRGLAWSALIGVAAVTLYGTAWNVRSGRKNALERSLAAQLRPETPLYTDRRTLRVLCFFWGWPAHVGGKDFQGLAPGSIPPGSYVLVNPEKLGFLAHSYGYDAPLLRGAAPTEWIETPLPRGARLYQVTPAALSSSHLDRGISTSERPGRIR